MPLIFSSENTGVAYGLGGVSIGAGQPQAALFALGFTSENDSKAISVGALNYQIPNITTAAVSVVAHCRAMSRCQPGMFEYEIEAELEYAFRQGGAQYPAYPSIVAGGENACMEYTSGSLFISQYAMGFNPFR